MNKVWKTTLITLALPTAMALILLLPISNSEWQISVLIFLLFYLLAALLAGLIVLAIGKNKEIGQGILMAAGIILVIGFSVCSGILK
jgi:FtsH-binding integral membrane protein